MSTNRKETKTSKAQSSVKTPVSKVSDSQRQHYIQVAAYNIAENNGFESGCDLENWLAAESEIDQLLADGKFQAQGVQ